MPEYIIYLQRIELGKAVIRADSKKDAQRIVDMGNPALNNYQIESTAKSVWTVRSIDEKEIKDE